MKKYQDSYISDINNYKNLELIKLEIYENYL